MPLLKKKKSAPEAATPEVDATPTIPEEFPPQTPAVDEDIGAMNKMEKEAAEELQNKREKESAIARLDQTVDYALDHFNLRGQGYTVRGFDDKLSKLVLDLSNGTFDVRVVIKDPDACGILLDA